LPPSLENNGKKHATRGSNCYLQAAAHIRSSSAGELATAEASEALLLSLYTAVEPTSFRVPTTMVASSYHTPTADSSVPISGAVLGLLNDSSIGVVPVRSVTNKF
jgi:hypothetical protein